MNFIRFKQKMTCVPRKQTFLKRIAYLLVLTSAFTTIPALITRASQPGSPDTHASTFFFNSDLKNHNVLDEGATLFSNSFDFFRDKNHQLLKMTLQKRILPQKRTTPNRIETGYPSRAPQNGLNGSEFRLAPVIPGPRHIRPEDMMLSNSSSGVYHHLSESPGYAFLASLILPGLGQAANQQWWKTAFFVAVEASAIGIYLHRENRGRDGERYYEKFGNQHWSVVQYAQFLVLNHSHQHGKSFLDLLTESGKQAYVQGMGLFGGIEPAFDIDIDWNRIDLQALRQAERNSLYRNGNAFSHDLPDYGSQQYYELMSKYFQFGPGWREWYPAGNHSYNIDDGIMPDQFWYHAQIGYDFNDDLSVARNMLTVLIANHIVAAFDAYFTQKIQSSRITPEASLEYGLRPTIGFHYRF